MSPPRYENPLRRGIKRNQLKSPHGASSKRRTFSSAISLGISRRMFSVYRTVEPEPVDDPEDSLTGRLRKTLNRKIF